jgi:zinc protease
MRQPSSISSALLIAAATFANLAAAADLSQARAFTLGNGLTVVMLHDPAQPVVAVQMLYRVGARNETPGITGIAHFLEHMLFRGTTSFGLSDVTGVIERAGGEWHGYTYLDCTTYFEAVPRDQLATLLRLEAERMTSGRMAADEVGPERGAVFQEYRGYQLDARSDLFDETIAALFLQHPYRNNTMGWESDLQAITHEDLVAFYRRYYGPRNAVLSIAGDFDPGRIEKQVREVFESIPPGGESTAIRTVEAPLTGPRRVTIRRPGATPALMISFLAPPPSRPKEYAALLVLDAVLGSAKGLSFRHHSGDLTAGRDVDPNSRLAVLARTAPVERFGTALVPTLYPYHYSIYATPKAGRPTEEIEPLVFGLLKSAAERIEAGEIVSARRRIEAALLIETDSPVEAAHELAFWHGLGGMTLRDAVVAALAGVAPQDVRLLARTLSADRAVIGTVLPAAGVETAPQAAVEVEAAAPAAPSTRPATAPRDRPARSGRPVPPKQPARSEVALVETLTLAPGSKAIVDTRPGQKTFVLKVALSGGRGAMSGPADAGRLRAVARGLGNDTDSLSRLADLGVRYSLVEPGEASFAERDCLEMALQGPAPALGEATEILAGALERHRAAAGGPLAAEPARDPEGRALRILSEALAPSAAVGAVRPAVSVALVSPFTTASAKPLLGAFAPERAGRTGAPDRPARAPFPSGRRVEAVQDISQGRLLLAFPGDGDPEALKALTYVLHHSYSGRLGVKAITEMGLVYSMDSESVTRGRPLLLVTMGAAPEALPSLEEALSEVLDRVAATLTVREIDEYRSFAAGDLIVRLSDPVKAATLWCSALLRGEDHRGPAAAVERARRLTPEEVALMARTALPKEKRLTVVVTRDGASGG